MGCNFCKRLTVSATSPDHFISRLEAFLALENQTHELPQAHAYHVGMGLALQILERTPITYQDLSDLLHLCSGITNFTPYPATEDEHYVFKRELKAQGLTVIDALVQPVQRRVEVIRAEGWKLRL